MYILGSKPADRTKFQSFKLRKIFQTEVPVKERKIDDENRLGYRYIIMELPIDRVPTIYKLKEKDIKKYGKTLIVKPYDPEKDAETFALIFNTILLTSPDPYRPMTTEEAKIFSPDGTFLAFLYGEPAGFAALTLEETENNRIGIIAGIGVMPKFRGKKVALALAADCMEWFYSKKVTKLQCEVYEFNDVSYSFISSLGFHEVGEMYLSQENVEDPTRHISN